MDHDPAPIYAKGNVVMIGDAAHVGAPEIPSEIADWVSRQRARSSAMVQRKQSKTQLPFMPFLLTYTTQIRFLLLSLVLMK